MTRPPRGPLNKTGIDHATDAWDTIDWLVKHVPESNGRVGMLGSSYEGFTVVMALTDPHPALKVAAPQSPMIDGTAHTRRKNPQMASSATTDATDGPDTSVVVLVAASRWVTMRP